MEAPVRSAILRRRSRRSGFDGRPVPDDVLAEVVRCGLAAPSSKNAQPWRFDVVTDRAVLGTIADAMDAAPEVDTYVPHDPATGRPRPGLVSTVRESAEVLRGASAGVFISNRGPFSGGRAAFADAAPTARAAASFGYTLELVGIGAAVENMWLVAEECGLGVAFMGDIVIVEDEIHERLELDGDLIGVLALGWSDAFPAPAQRQTRDTADPDIVRWHHSPNSS